MRKAHQFYGVRVVGGLFVVSGLLALLTAFLLQHYLHLLPCELCLWERTAWRVLIALGAFVLVVPPRIARWAALLGVLCLLGALGIGILHIGVEQGWWQSPAAACRANSMLVGPPPSEGSAPSWRSLPALPVKPCDRPDYPLGLPVRLTFLSLAYSAMVLVLAIYATWRMWGLEKRRHGKTEQGDRVAEMGKAE